jgi:hypothetical protein
MLNQAILEQLTDAIASRGGATPAVKFPQFYDVLNELFTSEEAEIAVKLPLESDSPIDRNERNGQACSNAGSHGRQGVITC